MAFRKMAVSSSSKGLIAFFVFFGSVQASAGLDRRYSREIAEEALRFLERVRELGREC